MKQFVVNGNIVTPDEIFEGAVFVKDGKIVHVEDGSVDAVALESEDIQVIDAHDKFILPGAIDAHVHFRIPGGETKEDWTHGSKAALAGGVTSVLDMPNTNPPTISQKFLEEKRTLVGKDAMVNYGFYAGATNDNVEEVAKMTGIAGVKIYMGSSTGNLLVDDLKVLEDFMTKTDHLLVLHAENEACIREHMAEHEGEEDPAVHSQIRDPECAAQAVKDALALAKKHKRRVHFTHVSTGAELELIREAKKDADYITMDVTPHHLFLSSKDYDQYGTLVRVNPPLRTEENQHLLWEGIADGTVDLVATDHAPHQLKEKEQIYSKAPSGLPGVQLMMPLLFHMVNEGQLTLEKVVELTSFHPAQKFGIEGKGAIEAGMDADFMIVDLQKLERVCHHYLWSKANWSPFHGWHLKGWPVMTFVGGELRYEWRDKFHEGKGSELTFLNSSN